MKAMIALLARAILILTFTATAAVAEECRDIELAAKRLACYDKEADFDNSMQQMGAVDLRLAQNAAESCGFVIDADRFRLRLVYLGLTWKRITDSRMYSPRDLRRIEEDAVSSEDKDKRAAYCENAWKDYGPDAELPDDFLLKSKSAASCK